MERKTTTPARPHVTALPDNDVSEQLKAMSGTLKFPDVAHDLVADGFECDIAIAGVG